MSSFKRPPVAEVVEAKDSLGVPDKADRSTGRVAQVAVYPHDQWEELDIEAGPRSQAAAAPVKPERWTKTRKVILAASLAGVVLLALALGLGLGLGLKKSPAKRVHRSPQALYGSPPPGVAPRAPKAGTTEARVHVDDAAQLDALLQIKAAVDTTNILKGQWTRSTGANHGYCDWKFVVCDASHRVVEGLNLTTDVYEVVFTGTLPSGKVLKGLPGLRELDMRLHVIKGTLPEDWAELTQLEVIRLDQNNLKGPLPAAWSRLRNLRVLTLWDNKLTGELPVSWADLRAVEILDVSYNKLTGKLPGEYANLASLQQLMLDVNKLDGPLPEDWAALSRMQKLFLSENALTGPLPDAWGDLGQLTDLWLDYNKLSGGLPASLGRLAQLQNLALNDNAFEGPIPSEWSGMKALTQLYAYNNARLSGCVPASFKEQLVVSAGFRLKDYVTMGTLVKGFC